MDPSSNPSPGDRDSQRVSVLQVTSPSAVIVATPAQSVAQIPESGALIVSQTPGSAPIIVGLIKPSDTGGLIGNSTAVIGVAPNPAISSTNVTPTRTIVPAMPTVTRVPSVSLSPSVGLTPTTSVVQSTQTKQQDGTHQIIKTSSLSILESVTQSGHQGSQTSKTGHTKKTGTTREQGTSNPAPPTPSGVNLGAGKPRAFAAMIGGEASGGGGTAKKQTPTAKKGNGSR